MDADRISVGHSHHQPPKICIVIGTRAQLIKTAPVMRELRARNLPYRFVYTSQHKDTMQEILDEFDIKPPDLAVVNREAEARSFGLMASWSLAAIRKLVTARQQIVPFRDGIVLIHGDTVSALWGALLGKLTGNRVFHLEAGLRSFDIFNPFPEEILRLIIPWLCDIYAPPGEWALGNLQRHHGPKINTRHNTLLDSLRYALDHHCTVELHEPPYVVASFKRVENLYNTDRLQQVMQLTFRVANEHRVVLMIHPLTRSRLAKTPWIDRLENHPNITLQNRLSYVKFVNLLSHAEFIMMDSGSSQEELSYLGVPTLLLRKATERQEGIGQNIVLSQYDEQIIDEFVSNYPAYRRERSFPDVSPSRLVVDWLEKNVAILKSE